ncbi:NUDIX hydrolase [Neobacillus dielmonensis]|uniref:NUDIX hydrolase n=1 Tax=Neobacillus dielmonensis TaxID=1347369 RepID=UPI0005A9E6D8|nr:NUDIX hydrolase [Neobacillus dielmonensis]
MSAIPRPASTVVLIDSQSRVYLTKRPETMKFMGGFYVFPGGAVDKGDQVHLPKVIDDSVTNESFNPAHYVAAARELFEEVGIVICKSQEGSVVHLDIEKQAAYRRQLLDKDITFYDFLIQEHLLLDFENLKYFGHIVTPEVSPIRFDTRFFLAKLPNGQLPHPDCHEISDAFWISPSEAISEYESGKISLAPPTLHSLKTIINYLNGEPLVMSRFHVNDYKLPFKK